MSTLGNYWVPRSALSSYSPIIVPCLIKLRRDQVNWKHVFSSVQFSCSVMSDSLRPHEAQHARPPCPSPTLGVHPNSCPLSQWCHSTISSSVIPFVSCLQSFPASRSYSNESVLHIRWAKYWSFSFSISPSNEYSGWFTLGWTGGISLQSKGFLRVFSNTTVQKHQFIRTQFSL